MYEVKLETSDCSNAIIRATINIQIRARAPAHALAINTELARPMLPDEQKKKTGSATPHDIAELLGAPGIALGKKRAVEGARAPC